MEKIPPSDPSPDSGREDEDYQQPWDENRWEAFLEEGDRRTEEYMALLDMYGDEPDGHNIITGAMGWEDLKTRCGEPPNTADCAPCDDREECPFHQLGEDGLIVDPSADLADAAEPADGIPDIDALIDPDADVGTDGFAPSDHPLIETAACVTAQAYEILGEVSDAARRGPASRLKGHLAASCGQLAAGLGEDEFNLEVLGLSIAYLKRAHKHLCLGLGAVSELRQTLEDKRDELADLRTSVETMRDKVAGQIQHYRVIFRDGTTP